MGIGAEERGELAEGGRLFIHVLRWGLSWSS